MAEPLTLPALVGGAVLGWASAAAARRYRGRTAVLVGGTALVTAAAVYPAARRDRSPSASLGVETGVLLGTAALTAAAVAQGEAPGRRLVAAGWIGHAFFDFLRGPSHDSRLPGWYAPACAGYDVAYAVRLVA